MLYVRYTPIILSGGGGGGGVTTVGTFDGNAPSPNGGSIVGPTLYFQSASATVPGEVNTTTQTFAGNKTFTGTIGAANLSGTNTGDVTIGTANGLSLAGQVLSLALSSTSTTGALSSTDWNTFNNKQSALTFGNLTDVGTDGITITNGTGAVIGSGTSISQQVADATHNGYLSSADWNTFSGKQGTITIGALDAQAANANGLALVANVLSTQSADATHPGMVNNTTQSFSGNKTFTGTIAASNFSGSSSGTNTGDVTLAAVGSSPNANAASLSGQVLNLQPANGSNPGVLTAGAQTIGGAKTFTGAISASNLSGTNTGDVTIGTANGLSLAGQVLSLALFTSSTPGAVSSSGGGTANFLRADGTWAAPTSSGANTALSNLAAVAINTSLLPGTTNTINLGSSSDIWATTFTGVVSGSGSSPSINLGSGLLIDSAGTNSINWQGRTLRDTSNVIQATWNTSGLILNQTVSANQIVISGASGFLTQLAFGAAGTMLQGRGSTTVPLFTVQPTLGVNGVGGTSGGGTLGLANGGTSGATATIQNLGATTAYNFNLPTTPGTAGQFLTSQGGGSTSMTWTTSSTFTPTAPTVQQFASGSGTYTTPTSPAPLYIRVAVLGGGGGGSGSGTAAGTAATGGTGSTFGTLVTGGGGAGVWQAAGGAGGTNTAPAGSLSVAGGGGTGAAFNASAEYQQGGPGGSSYFGGEGGGGATLGSAGKDAQANSGSGGGGGSSSQVALCNGGSGGGAGGYIEHIITSPSATYSYSVGAAGTAGGAGASGFAGGAGGSGLIRIEEFYQ